MGAVYQVEHVDLGKVAALKTLPAGEAGESVARRLQQEGKVLARLEDARVPDVLDSGVLEDGRPFVLMQYVQGRTLQAVIDQGGPWKVRAALVCAEKIAETLAKAHQVGLVHRDIKPANIILQDKNGAWLPWVIDFGVAHFAGLDSAQRTSQGMVVGTSGYWSPEQASADQIDGRSDTFSLGVVLYELLTGTLPFPTGATMLSSFQALFAAAYEPAGTRRPETHEPLWPEVETILARALERDRDRRYTMAEFGRALTTEVARMDGRPGERPLTPMSGELAPFSLSPTEQPTLAGASLNAKALLDKYAPKPGVGGDRVAAEGAAIPGAETAPGHRRKPDARESAAHTVDAISEDVEVAPAEPSLELRQAGMLPRWLFLAASCVLVAGLTIGLVARSLTRRVASEPAARASVPALVQPRNVEATPKLPLAVDSAKAPAMIESVFATPEPVRATAVPTRELPRARTVTRRFDSPTTPQGNGEDRSLKE